MKKLIVFLLFVMPTLAHAGTCKIHIESWFGPQTKAPLFELENKGYEIVPEEESDYILRTILLEERCTDGKTKRVCTGETKIEKPWFKYESVARINIYNLNEERITTGIGWVDHVAYAGFFVKFTLKSPIRPEAVMLDAARSIEACPGFTLY